MARQISSWLTKERDTKTGLENRNLKEQETHAEVKMKPENNSSKVKTEPSGKRKLGKSFGNGRNWEKARKGKKPKSQN